MTEDQIERWVECLVNRHDKAFMSGRMTDEAYDEAMRAVQDWANEQYNKAGFAKPYGTFKVL